MTAISQFFPSGQINNIPAFFQIVAWCQSGDSLAFIWTNDAKITDAYMRHMASMS